MSARPLEIQVRDARIEWRRAAERCPHWDADGHAGEWFLCCEELDDAEARYFELRDKLKRKP